jgi:hypothetical protein
MQLLDDSHCVIKTPEVIAYLYEQVLAEQAITSLATEIAPEPQTWGHSALHFAARLRAAGEDVLLKVNVAPNQLWWTQQLAEKQPELLPRVFGTGEQLGAERLGWVLWERVGGGLHAGWQGREFTLLLEAGVAFQRIARSLAPLAQTAGILGELRMDELAQGMARGIERGAPGPAERVLQRLAEDWAWVHAVCESEVCHGDLHMANALCRDEPPDGSALLIDHHPTRMPWVYEPAKPEILNAAPDRAGCRNLVLQQAAIRSRMGLNVPAQPDLLRLQAIVLGWWAIQIWGYIGPAPDPAWREPAIWHAENEAYIAAAAVT